MNRYEVQTRDAAREDGGRKWILACCREVDVSSLSTKVQCSSEGAERLELPLVSVMEWGWWEFGPSTRVPPLPDNLAAMDAVVSHKYTYNGHCSLRVCGACLSSFLTVLFYCVSGSYESNVIYKIGFKAPVSAFRWNPAGEGSHLWQSPSEYIACTLHHDSLKSILIMSTDLPNNILTSYINY